MTWANYSYYIMEVINKSIALMKVHYLNIIREANIYKPSNNSNLLEFLRAIAKKLLISWVGTGNYVVESFNENWYKSFGSNRRVSIAR